MGRRSRRRARRTTRKARRVTRRAVRKTKRVTKRVIRKTKRVTKRAVRKAAVRKVVRKVKRVVKKIVRAPPKVTKKPITPTKVPPTPTTTIPPEIAAVTPAPPKLPTPKPSVVPPPKIPTEIAKVTPPPRKLPIKTTTELRRVVRKREPTPTARELRKRKDIIKKPTITDVVRAREELKTEASRRGRGFTRIEAERFYKERFGTKAPRIVRAGSEQFRKLTPEQQLKITDQARIQEMIEKKVTVEEIKPEKKVEITPLVASLKRDLKPGEQSSVIGLPPEEPGKISFGEAARRSWQKLKDKITGKEKERLEKGELLYKEGFLAPFALARKTKEEREKDIVTSVPFSPGTIISGEPTFKTLGMLKEEVKLKYKDVEEFYTLSERAGYDKLAEKTSIAVNVELTPKYAKKMEDISKDLLKEYQDKVSKGELTVDAAQKQFEKDAQKQFEDKYSKQFEDESNKLFQDKYSKQSDRLADAYKKFGREKERGGAIIPKVGKVIGEFAPYITPYTAALAGAIKASKVPSPSITERVTTVVTSKEAKEIGKSIRAQQTKELRNIGIETLIGVVPFIPGKMKGLEKAFVKEELKQLSKTTPKFLEWQFERKGGKVFVNIITKQEFGNLKNIIKLKGEVFKRGNKAYIMPIGEASSETSGKLAWSILGGARPSKVIGEATFKIGGKGFTISLPKNVKLPKGMELAKLPEGKIMDLISAGKLKAFIAKSTVEPILSFSAIYKEPFKLKRGITFPTTREVLHEPKEWRRILKQFKKTLKVGGRPTLSIEEGLALKFKPFKEIRPGVTLKAEKEIFFTETLRGAKGLSTTLKEPPLLFTVTGKPAPFKKAPDLGIKIKKIPSKKTPFEKTFGKIEELGKPTLKPVDEFFAPQKLVKPKKDLLKPSKLVEEISESPSLEKVIKSQVKEIAKKPSKIFEPLLKKEPIKDIGKALTRGVLTGVTKEFRKINKDKLSQKLRQLQEQDLRKVTSSLTNLNVLEDVRDAERFKSGQLPKLGSKLRTEQKQKLRGQLRSKLQTSLVPKISVRPRLPLLLPPIIIPIGKGDKEKIRGSFATKEVKLFTPQARERGKWKTLSRKPLDERSAKSRMAFAVDHSTSAQGRIRPTAKKGKKTFNKGYYALTRKKFRDFKIVKGKKVPMDNKWIERRGISRIDTFGEKRGLKLAKLIKQQGWLKKKKKIKVI